MEVDSEYIYVDLLDTAGEVCLKVYENCFKLSFSETRVDESFYEICSRVDCPLIVAITPLIIKITISSIVIGFKSSYFPLIYLSSCYRTVFYRTACYRTVQ